MFVALPGHPHSIESVFELILENHCPTAEPHCSYMVPSSRLRSVRPHSRMTGSDRATQYSPRWRARETAACSSSMV